jgi:hypothetical protein
MSPGVSGAAPPQDLLAIDILSPDDLAQALFEGSDGNANAEAVVRLIIKWMIAVVSGEATSPCVVGCGARHARPSWSIFVARPFAAARGKCIVAGICPSCFAREDLVSAVNAKLSEFLGGGR